MHCHWRDNQEWSRLGLPMSTSSDEACKMFDATLTQWAASGEDDTIGGLKTTIPNMMSADPDFVMGHVLSIGLGMIGSGISKINSTEYSRRLETLEKLAASPNTNERERLHVQALQLSGDGFQEAAVATWEKLLVKYPLDLVALKFAYIAYIYLGTAVEMRDSVARVIPHWKPDMPHYCFLFGMYGFALNEANLHHQAEVQARKGLGLNPNDGWATHAVSHVMEMQGRQDEGISFLGSTVEEWKPADMIAGHNYWHWGLFHIEKGDYQSALDIFDAEVGPRTMANDVFFNLMNSSSLLFRLELEGVDVGDRWLGLIEKARPHIDDNSLAFGDAHTLMACLGSNQRGIVQQLMDGIAEFAKRGKGTYGDVTRAVSQALCQSLVAYNDGDFETAVELLYPRRYLLYRIGGSVAQRDLFNLFLIQACIKSPLTDHHILARQLLYERKAFKDHAPMTDRLMVKALALSID